MPKYHFGDRAFLGGRAMSPMEIEALSLNRAIRIFRVTCLFPHEYTDGPVYTEHPGKSGYMDRRALSSKPGAMVPIHSPIRDAEQRVQWVKVGEIPPEDAAYEDLPSTVAAIEGHVQGAMEAATSSALVLAGGESGLSSSKTSELASRRMELDASLGRLEIQRRELQAMVQAMEKEVERRRKQIWLIELFIGSKEEVVTLREGSPASASTPITLRQQVLCMDEIMAVHDWLEDPEQIGKFSVSNVEDFDQWLVKNPDALEQVCPWPKALVGLRIRRFPRSRDNPVHSLGEAYMQAMEDQDDRCTYFLLRNGQNLYRIWADVSVWPRLFPSAEDLHRASGQGKEGEESWQVEHQSKEAQARVQTNVAGMLVLQGLLDRSELLHPLPVARVNVFEEHDQALWFNLVRDDEMQVRGIEDRQDPFSGLTWARYRNWLDENLVDGCRVLWVGKREYDESNIYTDKALYDRTGGALGYRAYGAWPRNDNVYVLSVEKGERGKKLSFLYTPGDEIWKPDEEGYITSQPRSRRTRFSVSASEVLNIDLISARVVEYLIRDSRNRAQYGRFFRTLFLWWDMARKEAERERPFVDLVLKMAGAEISEETVARVQRLVRWWKFKVHEHRSLSMDEPKALRMVMEAFQAGADYDGDPERTLFERRGGS